ncbi:MAG: protein kinase domain-containing protein [Terriglobales bacterium]
MLASGTCLGPYEVLSLLGSGGMGEVYRARDARLGREVAIKVLGESFAADPERLRRFEQEAHTLAALNHPNLLAIFDVGRHDGAPYLVSELLVGQTLQAQLQAGPVGPRKAVEWGRQIAGGLAAAHERGIVHRDLKPANIFVTTDGRVKILDFGLARLTAAAAGPDDPTVLAVVGGTTLPGMTLGTVGYMAPEQVRGEPADARADIFAFGALLYEMLTGAKPFQRSTAADTMSAILRDEPAEAPPAAPLPPALDRVVRRCLEKQPQQRFQNASDLAFSLDAALGSSVTGSHAALAAAPEATTSRPAGGPAPWRWAALAAIALLIAGAVTAWLRWPHPFDIGRLQYTPFSSAAGGQSSPVWSPDGKAIAFALSPAPGVSSQVYVRYLSSNSATPLTHLDTGATPFAWTPDNGRVLYVSGSGVYSVSVTGGEPTRLLDLASGPAHNFGDVNGSTALALSPDGTSLVGMMQFPSGAYGLAVSSPPGAPPKQLPNQTYASHGVINQPTLAFAPNGKSLLFFWHPADRGRDEAWLIPWPASSGPPRRVLSNLPIHSITPTFSWMPDSRRIAIGLWGAAGLDTRLWMVNVASGRRVAISPADSTLVTPAISPSGNQLVYANQDVNFDVVNVNLADGRISPLLDSLRMEATPSWAGHAPLLAYVGDLDGPVEIWLHSPGAPDRPLLPASMVGNNAPGILLVNPMPNPDGTRVVYGRIGSLHAAQRSAYLLWIAALSGGAPQRLTDNPPDTLEFGGAWSPDGSQFALLESGPQTGNKNAAVAVVSTGGQAAPTIIANDADSYVPNWSPTSQWIVYRADNAQWTLISPDGKQRRVLAKIDSPAMAFSSDGRTLYGIRPDGAHHGVQQLVSISVAGGPIHVIATLSPEDAPQSLSNPGTHFTLTPDGKSLTYSILKPISNLWLITGLRSALP